MKITHIDKYKDFLDLREEWTETLQRCNNRNIFSTWEWLTLWWKHFGTNRRLMILLAENCSKTIGIAPLMCSAYRLFGVQIRKIEFIGSGASDYCDFILAEKANECVRCFMEYLIDVPEKWNYIELTDISKTALSLKVLRASSNPARLAYEKPLHECHFIPIPVSKRAYLEDLSRSQRKDLRRNARRLERDFRVDYVDSSQAKTLEDDMNAFFDLHQRRWTAKSLSGIFSSQQARNFHMDVARVFSQKGWLGLFMLKLSETPVSAHYGFRYHSKFYYYLSGYDPKFSKFGVGSLLTQHVINTCIQEGLKEFDFLRGSENYKNRWNTKTRGNLQLVLTKRGFLSSLSAFLYTNWWSYGNKINYFSRNLKR